MTRKEGLKLKPGDIVSVVMPGETTSDPYTELLPGTLVKVSAIIPKVRIVKGFPWKDSHEEFIFGHVASGETKGARAWLNFVNAKKEGK